MQHVDVVAVCVCMCQKVFIEMSEERVRVAKLLSFGKFQAPLESLWNHVRQFLCVFTVWKFQNGLGMELNLNSNKDCSEIQMSW